MCLAWDGDKREIREWSSSKPKGPICIVTELSTFTAMVHEFKKTPSITCKNTKK
jgi:hypothetical protein